MAQTPKVLNCSDIEVSIGASKIAHITEGRFSGTHDPREIFSNDTAPYKEDEPGMLSWQITGNALIQMYTGYSFKDLLNVWKNRVQVSITAKIGDAVTITGKATLTNFDGGGATEQNGTCSFTFKGSKEPEFGDVDSDTDTDTDNDSTPDVDTDGDQT
jgi:hypothetical protein